MPEKAAKKVAKKARKASPETDQAAEPAASKKPPRPKVVTSQANTPVLTVERLPIDQVLPSERNARAHDERNLAAIRASWEEHGQVEPLLMRKESNRLIGGNGRLQVAKDLGWTEVSVIRLSMGQLKSESLGIHLNRTAELGHWDLGVLGEIGADLRDAGIELTNYGWSAEELEAVFKPTDSDLDAGFANEPDAPETPAPKAAAGESGPEAEAGQEADHVRMVQLFFSEKTQAEFMGYVDAAMVVLQTENVTDTVLEILRQYSASSSKAA